MQSDINPNSEKSDELEILSIWSKSMKITSIQFQNRILWKPLNFRLEQLDLPEAYLGRIFGYASRKSEILSGKRKLNLTMIRKLNEKLHITADVLIQDYYEGLPINQYKNVPPTTPLWILRDFFNKKNDLLPDPYDNWEVATIGIKANN